MTTYKCPHCGESVQPGELQQPVGLGGGTYCPKCSGRVYFSFKYGWQVAVLSIVFAVVVLRLVRVKAIIVWVVGTPLIAIPMSMYLNVLSSRLKPPVLRKWQERRRKSFFEWLYERDSPTNLIDKR